MYFVLGKGIQLQLVCTDFSKFVIHMDYNRLFRYQ